MVQYYFNITKEKKKKIEMDVHAHHNYIQFTAINVPYIQLHLFTIKTVT